MHPIIKQLKLGPLDNFVYIVVDPATKQAAVVDPGWHAPAILETAEKLEGTITHILLTHAHFDHANVVGKLIEETGATVYVNAEEAGVDIKKVETRDGDRFKVGELEVVVIHTPGHTGGSQCFLIGDALFTGDTLFVGGIGRTDLEGGDPEAMFHSLMKLIRLKDGIVVYPGHHYGRRPTSTIGEEKKLNPYMRARSVEEFLRQ